MYLTFPIKIFYNKSNQPFRKSFNLWHAVGYLSRQNDSEKSQPINAWWTFLPYTSNRSAQF